MLRRALQHVVVVVLVGAVVVGRAAAAGPCLCGLGSSSEVAIRLSQLGRADLEELALRLYLAQCGDAGGGDCGVGKSSSNSSAAGPAPGLPWPAPPPVRRISPPAPALLCNGTSPATSRDYDTWLVLAKLYNATRGGNWTTALGGCWDPVSPTQVCVEDGQFSNWEGVTCNGGGVIGLSLASHNLVGPVSAVFDAMRDLPGIEFGTFQSNFLSGTLPSVWPNWTASRLDLSFNPLGGRFVPTRFPASLVSLQVAYCGLEGLLPSETGSGVLQNLDLTGNLLSGTFPADWNLVALKALHIGSNRLSGRLPARVMGLDRLTSLSFDTNALEGFIGLGLPLLQNLDGQNNAFSGDISLWAGLAAGPVTELKLYNNRLSGTLDQSVWEPAAATLSVLDLHSNLLSGSVPQFVWNMTQLDLSDNQLSGELQIVVPGGASQLPVQHVSLARNRLSGTVPRLLLAAGSNLALDLSSNQFSAVDLSGVGQPPASGWQIARIDLSNNSIGEVDQRICGLGGELRSLDLSHNQLQTAPGCLGELPGLRFLDVSFNFLANLPPYFSMSSPNTTLEVFLAAHNQLGADGNAESLLLAPVGVRSSSVVQVLDLSHNPLSIPSSPMFRAWRDAFPRLSVLRLRSCDLRGPITDGWPGLRELDVGQNPGFQGPVFGYSENAAATSPLTFSDSFASLSVFSLDETQYFYPPLTLPAKLQVFDRSNLGSSLGTDCLPPTLLRSPSLQRVDIVGALALSADWSGFGPLCRSEMRQLLKKSEVARRTFMNDTLSCPQWLTVAAEAVVNADPVFLRFDSCRCNDRSYWAGARCEQCPGYGEQLLCDPFVIAPRHCLLGNLWPLVLSPAGGADPDWARARYVEQLPTAHLVQCGRPGLCNVDATCVAPSEYAHTADDDVLHELSFRCADGHDPSSLVCSRCGAGRWREGSSCLECHGAVANWMVPISLVATGVLGALYMFRRARSPDSRRRTVSIALLWLQLTAVLETSSTARSQRDSTTVWPWLAGFRALLQSWVTADPFAAECLFSRFDWVDEALVVLFSPVVALGAGLVATACVAKRLRGSVRLVVAQVFVGVYLPVSTRAFQAFGCVRFGPVLALSAAPYVSCERNGRLDVVRVCALAVLVFYSIPVPLVCLFLARRVRPKPAEAVGNDDSAMALPLLGADDAGDWTAPGDEGVREDLGEGGMVQHMQRLRNVDGGDESEGKSLASDLHMAAAAAVAEADNANASVTVHVLLGSLRDPQRLWFWMGAGLLRQLCMSALVGLLPPSSTSLAVGVFGVLAASAIAQEVFLPWQSAVDNALELLVLLSCLCLYLICIISSGGTSGDSDSSQNIASVVNIGVLVAFFGAFVHRHRTVFGLKR